MHEQFHLKVNDLPCPISNQDDLRQTTISHKNISFKKSETSHSAKSEDFVY